VGYINQHAIRHKGNKDLMTIGKKKALWFIIKHFKHTKIKKLYASLSKYIVRELVAIDVHGEKGKK
jgi:hypothetical protein